MDIYVNSEALIDAQQGLTSPLVGISECLSGLKMCISSAKGSFQTVNSDSVQDFFDLFEKGIENMQGNVSNAQRFLQNLNECLEKYNSLRY